MAWWRFVLEHHLEQDWKLQMEFSYPNFAGCLVAVKSISSIPCKSFRTEPPGQLQERFGLLQLEYSLQIVDG